jgi:hypothetical protein
VKGALQMVEEMYNLFADANGVVHRDKMSALSERLGGMGKMLFNEVFPVKLLPTQVIRAEKKKKSTLPCISFTRVGLAFEAYPLPSIRRALPLILQPKTLNPKPKSLRAPSTCCCCGT